MRSVRKQEAIRVRRPEHQAGISRIEFVKVGILLVYFCLRLTTCPLGHLCCRKHCTVWSNCAASLDVFEWWERVDVCQICMVTLLVLGDEADGCISRCGVTRNP